MRNRLEAEERIEDLLDHLALGLSPLPPSVRAEVRAEVGAHLRSAVDERIVCGMSEEEAVRDAVRRFGPPERIAVRFIRAWERSGGVVPPWRSVVTGLAVAPLAALAVGSLPVDPSVQEVASGLVAALAGALVGLAAPTRPTLRPAGVMAWAFGATLAGIAATVFVPQADLLVVWGDSALAQRLAASSGLLAAVAPAAGAATAGLRWGWERLRIGRSRC